MARAMIARVSATSVAVSGWASHRRGGSAQWWGARSWSAGRKRLGSTAWKSPEASSPARVAKGTVRRSRIPRVLARLTRMRKIQVRSDERPSKRSRPAQHREPRLLHDLLGDRLAGHEAARQAQHRRALAIDELHECGLVAGAQALEQSPVGLGGARVLEIWRRGVHAACRA